MQTIDRIFGDYIKQKESSESTDNKREIELALKSLQTKCDVKYYPKLIDVWMYYDPTDFPTRELVLPILLQNRSEGLKAIEKRIRKRMEWETKDTAPYSDLLSLRDDFKMT